LSISYPEFCLVEKCLKKIKGIDISTAITERKTERNYDVLVTYKDYVGELFSVDLPTLYVSQFLPENRDDIWSSFLDHLSKNG
jgi:hypothetical protein